MKTRWVLLAMLGASSYAQTGTFTPTGNMTAPRFFHTATLLPNGKVLITGGDSICVLSCFPEQRAELYDPATGTFTVTGSMSTAYPGGAALLPDGKVLITGQDITRTMASLEIYDPSTGNFTAAGKPATLTGASSATLLSDGRVLLIGIVGAFVNGAEVYDPASGTFTPIANWPEQQSWSPVALADGTVLLVRCGDCSASVSDETESERYDPATGAFSATGSIGYFDDLPRPTLLPNGNVLFTGGNTDFGNDSRAELYDPATGTFASTGSMSTARNYHSATLLPDGTVVVAGGMGQSGSTQPPLASAEIYDPAPSGFSTTGSLASPRYGHTATLLNNGQVLITGGSATAGGNSQPVGSSISGLSSAELYTPAVLVPAPVLFSISGDGRGQGAIWHAATGQLVSVAAPATAGEILSMYATGLMEGGVIPPQVAVGGRLAQIQFFGDAPGYPGYYQVNFQVPAGVAAGSTVPVRLTYLGRSSNRVTMGVQ
jgi:Galactose oxidase, central domain